MIPGSLLIVFIEKNIIHQTLDNNDNILKGVTFLGAELPLTTTPGTTQKPWDKAQSDYSLPSIYITLT